MHDQAWQREVIGICGTDNGYDPALHDASEKGILPAPLTFAKQDDAPWTKLEMKNPEKFSGLKE